MDYHGGKGLMMGRSHLIAGACALEHAYVAGVLIDRSGLAPLTEAKQLAESYLGFNHPAMLTIPVCVGAYFLGTLLPDIDNPNSILGRFVHIPVKHRTWIHAIYLYLILLALSLVHPAFLWAFLGVFIHLFWDSFSICGVCWFYKLLSDYYEYPNGAKVKKGHKLKLYRVGEWSEYLLLFIIVVVTVVSFVWIRRL